MSATQSSRLGVPRQATVTPLRRIRRRPSTFASGFRPSIVASSPQKVRGMYGRELIGGRALQRTLSFDIVRQPYECRELSVKAPVVRANGGLWARTRRTTRWNGQNLRGLLFVDERIVTFGQPPRDPASDGAKPPAVDSRGHVDKLWAISAPPAGARESGEPGTGLR